MNRPDDHSTYSAWLELELDGRLPEAQRSRLAAHLESCADCRAERDDLHELDQALRRARIPVRPGFASGVMAALPPAGWEAGHPRAWRLPVAVFVLLGGIAAALLGASSAGFGVGSSALGALLAVGGLFQAALLAGAGLLSASWKGLGMAIGEMLASPLSLAAFGVLVLCLNLLVVSLIRRRRTAAQALPARRGGAGGRRPAE